MYFKKIDLFRTSLIKKQGCLSRIIGILDNFAQKKAQLVPNILYSSQVEQNNPRTCSEKLKELD